MPSELKMKVTVLWAHELRAAAKHVRHATASLAVKVKDGASPEEELHHLEQQLEAMTSALQAVAVALDGVDDGQTLMLLDVPALARAGSITIGPEGEQRACEGNAG
jgi:hypothetical protein